MTKKKDNKKIIIGAVIALILIIGGITAYTMSNSVKGEITSIDIPSEVPAGQWFDFQINYQIDKKTNDLMDVVLVTYWGDSNEPVRIYEKAETMRTQTYKNKNKIVDPDDNNYSLKVELYVGDKLLDTKKVNFKFI